MLCFYYLLYIFRLLSMLTIDIPTTQDDPLKFTTETPHLIL